MKAQLEPGWLGRAASRTALRLIDRVPMLRQRFFVAMAAE
jgi:hypothetical protein